MAEISRKLAPAAGPVPGRVGPDQVAIPRQAWATRRRWWLRCAQTSRRRPAAPPRPASGPTCCWRAWRRAAPSPTGSCASPPSRRARARAVAARVARGRAARSRITHPCCTGDQPRAGSRAGVPQPGLAGTGPVHPNPTFILNAPMRMRRCWGMPRARSWAQFTLTLHST